ncbi:MAG: 4Fe-4S domain-containing protein, partial [Gemmatimonadales bacterium]
YKRGEDGIADPFAAISAIPAATSTIRDMTDVRFEVPEFIAANCTGCSQCWVQCPDSAIPGLVTEVEQLLAGAIRTVPGNRQFDRLKQLIKPLVKESRRLLKSTPFTSFGEVLSLAYESVVEKLNYDPQKRAALDAEFAPVCAVVSEFPVAKTAPYFDVPESKKKGTGGLLSITINPDACKGCNICVDVCPDGALVTAHQTDEIVDRLHRNWELWNNLPDTDDRYVNIASLDEGIGVLPSLLLKKRNYQSMAGGDNACMGCGEKTGVHLVLAAVNAMMLPRVSAYVEKLDGLIAKLDKRARDLIAADADLDDLSLDGTRGLDVPLGDAKRESLARIRSILTDLKDLRWRYVEGPGGRGRSVCGFSNATGCSSVWASTYPFNPYPFPWVNHLFQDAPSVAIGIFEGQMRRMADGFIAVRRAELELAGTYDSDREEDFGRFDWHDFNDEEFSVCPPLFAVGGDGAMLDIGFQNLSRMMASGKPIRVIVLDTQVYSNTGGQACTSGFLGQVSDMAAYGASKRGKEEIRKELSLIAMAHRDVFVLQSTQASASHLLGGVLRGLQSKYPALFILHCPCPPEHGIADRAVPNQARLALETRAFPLLVHDPAAGATLADRLSLDGNPSPEDDWPEYELAYIDDDGNESSMTIPLTTADWAATERRFKKHFRRVKEESDDLVQFHGFLRLDKEERAGKTPFIYTITDDRTLERLALSDEMVDLAEERLGLWIQLKELAGLEVAASSRYAVEQELEAEFAQRLQNLEREYQHRVAQLKESFPPVIARRMAEGLLRAGRDKTIEELLVEAEALPSLELSLDELGLGGNGEAATADPPVGSDDAVPTSMATVEAIDEDVEEEEDFAIGPYIETARCTSCDECINVNRRLFAYDDNKQAVVQDPNAGTFRELVMAAEKCPVEIIHPGAPLNSKEKDLEKWIKRAERFN